MGDLDRPRSPAPDWVPPSAPLAPDAASVKRSRCVVCDGERLEGRQALLNTRLFTRFGLDWLNRVAAVVRCPDCGHVSWFDGSVAK